MSARWVDPFTCLITGPSGCGKTVFVSKFIKHLPALVTTMPVEIIWCFGQWQSIYETMTNVQFHEGLPDIDKWQDNKPRLLIIDDLMHEIDQRISKLFTKGSHHLNISVMYLTQNLFDKNKEHRTISLNTHYIVVFKNPRDGSQITHLAKQMYPGRVGYVQESFKLATSDKHGYLLIDLTQSTPDDLRLRSNIFPDEFQVVYVPK